MNHRTSSTSHVQSKTTIGVPEVLGNLANRTSVFEQEGCTAEARDVDRSPDQRFGSDTSGKLKLSYDWLSAKDKMQSCFLQAAEVFEAQYIRRTIQTNPEMS